MDLTYQEIVSYIEFPSFVKKRSIYVKLNNECFFGAVVVFFLSFYDCIKLVHFVNNSDSVPSIGEFSRFDNPNISERSFDDLSVLHFLLLSFDGALSFLVIGCKSFVLWIFHAFFDVESQGNNFE